MTISIIDSFEFINIHNKKGLYHSRITCFQMLIDKIFGCFLIIYMCQCIRLCIIQKAPVLYIFFSYHIKCQKNYEDNKTVNDTYGHAAGDAVLKLFGQLLRTNFRKEDVIGRIGGDEFVVLLKNLTAKEETNAHIEHLLSEIRDQYIDEIEGKITISIGICFAPENGSTFMDLYRCADRALYQTKQNGRDGYTFYTK